MIKHLQLKNFQSHADTTLEFHPNINVIVGNSDSGKSAIVRALKAVIEKAPFYIRDFQKEGSVELVFADQLKIIRNFEKRNITKCPNCKEKVKSEWQECPTCGQMLMAKMAKDSYNINGTIFKSFGVKLPQEILDQIQIYPVNFIDYSESFNIINQHDSLFFISDAYSGGLRNKILSSLIPDSEVVDLSIKKLNSEAISIGLDYDYLLKRSEETGEIIKKHTSDIQELEMLVQEIETLKVNIQELELMKNNLMTIHDEIEQLNTTIKKFPNFDKLNNAFRKIRGIYSDIEQLEKNQKLLLVDFQQLKQTERVVGFEYEEYSLKDELDTTKDLILESDELNKLHQDLKLSNNVSSFKKSVFEHFERFEEFKIVESICSLLGKFDEESEKIQNGERLLRELNEEIFSLQDKITCDLCPITNAPFCEDCKRILKHETK